MNWFLPRLVAGAIMGQTSIQPGQTCCQSARKSKWGTALLTAAWGSCVFIGLLTLWHYSATAGSVGLVPHRWPIATESDHLAGPDLGTDRPTLLMFAHPKCPCTRASLHELVRVVESANTRATVIFWQPTGFSESDSASWIDSATVATARSHADLDVIFDADGTIANRFGAETSGHCVVYGTDGELLFSGGITDGRGHEGENRGKQSVDSWLSMGTKSGGGCCREAARNDEMTFPVFGCPLRSPAADDN